MTTLRAVTIALRSVLPPPRPVASMAATLPDVGSTTQKATLPPSVGTRRIKSA